MVDNEKLIALMALMPEVIFGAEEDEIDDDETVDGEDNDDNDSSNQSDSENDGDNEDEDEDENDDADSGKKPKEDGRTTALKAERKLRREKAAENARLRRENEALKRKDMEETERLQLELKDALEANETTNTRYQKLVDGYRNSAIKDAILREAEKQNFIDPSDVVNHLAGVDLAELFSVEQDEDDPSVIDIDLKAVSSEIKKLATSKPHYINKGTEDGQRSGSGFGGSRRKKKEKDESASLRELYPNL